MFVYSDVHRSVGCLNVSGVRPDDKSVCVFPTARRDKKKCLDE